MLAFRYVELLAARPVWFQAIATIFGLVIGSFLNVVIHRLPIILEHAWETERDPEGAGPPPFNIALPASHCPHCRAELKAYDNIPLLSFLALRGRCRYCRHPIAWRYPAIELVSGLLCLLLAHHFGPSLGFVASSLLVFTLVALSAIDLEHQILPDLLTLPLIWAGLIVNSAALFTGLHAAVFGAVWGYLSLWLLYHAFKMITGKEGMGYGDFKLFAVAGAWLGWLALPLVILIASFMGAAVGLTLIALKRHERAAPIPFGPFLCAGMVVALLWNGPLVTAYLHLAR